VKGFTFKGIITRFMPSVNPKREKTPNKLGVFSIRRSIVKILPAFAPPRQRNRVQVPW
jgi:hypothetical protein